MMKCITLYANLKQTKKQNQKKKNHYKKNQAVILEAAERREGYGWWFGSPPGYF